MFEKTPNQESEANLVGIEEKRDLLSILGLGLDVDMVDNLPKGEIENIIKDSGVPSEDIDFVINLRRTVAERLAAGTSDTLRTSEEKQRQNDIESKLSSFLNNYNSTYYD